MARGLNLQIASQDGTKWLDVYLPANVTINITHNSQIWNAKAGSFSETISLPIEQNLHILGNLASMHGCDVYKLLYGRHFRLFGAGILIFYGVIHLDEEVSIKSNAVDIELAAANLEWDDLIADLDCRDIPLTYNDIDEITLGKTVSGNEIAISMSYRSREVEAYYEDGKWAPSYGLSYECAGQEPVDKIKIPDLVILESDFFNVTNPYPTRKFCNIDICWQKEDSDGNKLREYEVASGVRENSSPCFYVMYFLECLFKHLGIAVKKNDMLAVHDICRLAFINTACYYEVGPQLSSEYNFDLHDYFEFNHKYKSGYGLEKTTYPEYPEDPGSISFHEGDEYVLLENIKFYFGANDTKPYRALATSKNFPDKDVKSVVSAIMDGFGGRLIYNSVDKTAQIVLLRNILRQTDYTEIPCKIISVYQQQNSKAGFRMRYSATTVDKEEDYDDKERDTMYNYTEYNEVIETRYQDIYKTPRIYDNNTYIDPVTGDAFRVKVDKDAKDKKTLYPSWFEVAQFCRVEYGDCSNEDNVEEVVVDFTPVTMNVVSTTGGYEDFAYLVDVDIENGPKEIPEEVYFDSLWVRKNKTTVKNDSHYHFAFSLNLVVKTQCAYNPSEVAGNPLNDVDNGFTLGFCRGLFSSTEKDDGYGNKIWEIVGAGGIVHEDTMDSFGNVFDYDGPSPGTGGDSERISLKLRAEKPNAASGLYPVSTHPKRGLYDRFYTEYARWITEGRVAVIEAEVELAWLANIDLTKKYKIGDYLGLLKDYKYPYSDSEGLGTVTFELLYLAE